MDRFAGISLTDLCSVCNYFEIIMFADQSFVSQFQAEMNLIFANTDMDGQLTDLLLPLKTILDNQTSLVAYSLARRTGAPTDIAFFCEWYYQIFCITSDLQSLIDSNQTYWTAKLQPKYPEIQEIQKHIDNDINRSIIPQQLALLHQKTAELLADLGIKHEYLKKYLNHRYLNQFLISSMKTNQQLNESVPSLDSYLEIESRQNAFLQLCFPLLLGFLHDFSDSESVINPTAIHWEEVEKILYGIACLEQIGEGWGLLTFLHGERLDEKERIEWILENEETKRTLAQHDVETNEIAHQVTKSIYINAKLQLRNLVFPDTQKQLIEQILEYSVRYSKQPEGEDESFDQKLNIP